MKYAGDIQAIQEEYNDLEEEYAYADSRSERLYLADRMKSCLSQLEAHRPRSRPGT